MSRTTRFLFASLAASLCGACHTDQYGGYKWCVINDLSREEYVGASENTLQEQAATMLYYDADTQKCVPCDTIVDRRRDYDGVGTIFLVKPH